MALAFDWGDLRYFLAVARTGTVSAAARRLAVDHATVIRRIDALERGLSTKLFERTLRGYGLTRTGIKLLEAAAKIDHEAAHIEAEIGSAGEISGHIRVSSLEGFGNFFLASRLPAFTRAYPRLRIELLTIQQIVALSRWEADLIITLNPPNLPKSDRKELVNYRLFVYGSQEYLASSPEIHNRDDLVRHPFSGYIDDLVFTRGLDYLSEILPGLRPALQSSSLYAQMEFACAGHGLCVLPAFIARSRPQLVPILPHEIMLERSYWLVEPSQGETSLAVHTAASWIRERVSAERHLFQ
ncbi:LysR family transcriptional regulator [Sphingobium sp. DC-2]|uniref:LysR family transcriptional regulator n=1 Tax=Sphingobium sp. DC-2 TaxID=1303256 RepID=UPI00056AA28E|nr:LysR family transcriptional regulator [Sphingobium sp. DC-2]